MSEEIYMIGDVVYYTGTKFRDRLNGKKGWLHARVVGSSTAWVVEFPDTRNNKDKTDSDDYVMSTRVLTHQHHAAPAAEKKQEGPEVQPRRRKRDPEEE
jgi:hypothetical protein